MCWSLFILGAPLRFDNGTTITRLPAGRSLRQLPTNAEIIVRSLAAVIPTAGIIII